MKRPLILAPCLALGALVAAGAGGEEPADLWLNGSVYASFSSEGRLSKTNGLLVRKGRIVAVGSGELRSAAGEGARVHDLGGRCVTAGLIDSHCHMSSLGFFASGRLDLRDAKSFEEVVRAVADAAAKAKPGDWILGGRWDQSLWPGGAFPSHERLSEASPRNPVWLERVDGHMGLANARALELAGIGPSTPDPPGGEVLRDSQKRPTGLLSDNAMSLIERHIPGGRLAPEELILAAQERCLAAGLTGVHDAGIGEQEIEAYRRLAGSGRLKLRVHAMVGGGAGAAYFRAHRPLSGDRFSLRAVKLMADGAMGSRGAWLLEPYADRPLDSSGKPYTGYPVQKPEFIREVAQAAFENGWQVCTHAIGDRAVREALDAYQTVLAGSSGKDHRFRIEHAQNPHAQDILRFARLGVIASMQPGHATSDMRWAEARVGPERVRTAYAWRRFLAAGVRLAFGSDFPVEEERPLRGIYAAVTRQDPEGRPEGGWLPEERLTREEALRAYTAGAAHASFDEGRQGSLDPGRAADFVVWDRDIIACPPGELLAAKPVMVVIGGEVCLDSRHPDRGSSTR